MNLHSIRPPWPVLPMVAGLAIAALADRLSGGLPWLDWLALILLPAGVVMTRRGLAAGRAAVRRLDETGRSP